MSGEHEMQLNGHAVVPRLRERASHAQSCPPHRWGCPVVMKLDPRSVAWTCASCGAIVTTPDAAVPPAPA
ncbi:MAG TPA: hypothetical protein VKS25_14920 [Solirubrobacteraceae bacterium]|nr:hypothetical protein [Solirubrobacteraceae bacterium]